MTSAERRADQPALSSPVWRLLLTFSWQEWRHHGLRNSTAVLAVLLGVALAFSVHLINQSALSEFSAAVRTANGQADLSVRAAHGQLSEALYPQLAQHPQVALASPVLEVNTQAIDAHGGHHSLKIVGLDALVAFPLAPALIPSLDHGEDPLLMFSPDTIALNATARQALQVKPGDTIEVQSGLRLLHLRVMGSLASPGVMVGVMDIAGVQTHFGHLGHLSRIDLQLVHGITAEDFKLAVSLPPGVLIESPGDTGERVSNLSKAYRVNLTVLALVALFTGAFLVFSILSLSVAKRQQQFALLGVLGLTARERMQLVLLESSLIGVLGSALGLAAGMGLAAMALRLLAGDLGGGYFPGIAPHLQWSAPAALIYGALGVAAAVLGGWLPARQAQLLAPAQALKGQGTGEHATLKAWVGPALLLLGASLSTLKPLGGVPLWAYLGVAALLMGGIACVPATVGAVLKLVPPPRQATWLLAIERARHMRSTATVAIAGVVASLSLSVALTVMVSSFRGSVSAWLDTIMPADLYARTAASPDSDTLSLAPGLVKAIETVPGVARVVGIRITPMTFKAGMSPVDVLARPVDDPARTMPVVGPLLPARKGMVSVYVSEAMVDLYGARPGTVLPLPLVPGQPPTATHVRGVWRDYARQYGAVVIAQSDYQAITHDLTVNNLAIWLEPAAKTATVETAIRSAAASQGLADQLIDFAEPREIRQTTLRIFDRSFAVTYWLQAVAIAIGLFGTAASFSAQVLARRKEFGLLSHLGLTRQQVLGIVAGEGLALTTVGALMGLALGLAVSVVLIKVVNPQSFHWTMDIITPWGRLAWLCLGVIAAGTVTAVVAGKRAAGKDAVMAVKEDW
jgi:putative ABC transport system permease protein